MINSAVSMKDLGVMRSAGYEYEGQCRAIAAKANKVAGMIRQSFQQKSPQLLWPAFQYYVAPALLYCSPAWRSYLRKGIKLLERFQRRYTKRMNGLKELAYNDRLKKLNALTVDNRMTYAGVIFVYKSLNGHLGYPGDDLGLLTVVSRTRRNRVAFVQRRAVTNATASIFILRAPSSWNKIPMTVV